MCSHEMTTFACLPLESALVLFALRAGGGNILHDVLLKAPINKVFVVCFDENTGRYFLFELQKTTKHLQLYHVVIYAVWK